MYYRHTIQLKTFEMKTTNVIIKQLANKNYRPTVMVLVVCKHLCPTRTITVVTILIIIRLVMHHVHRAAIVFRVMLRSKIIQ